MVLVNGLGRTGELLNWFRYILHSADTWSWINVLVTHVNYLQEFHAGCNILDVFVVPVGEVSNNDDYDNCRDYNLFVDVIVSIIGGLFFCSVFENVNILLLIWIHVLGKAHLDWLIHRSFNKTICLVSFVHGAVILVQEIMSLSFQEVFGCDNGEKSTNDRDENDLCKKLQEVENIIGVSLCELNVTSNLRNFVVLQNWLGDFKGSSSLNDCKYSSHNFDESKEGDRSFGHLED